ncbi:hypothetical protein AM499_06880 [Bacillus sp. FJAT-22090]|uniref:hypothetical protein n=1 Tax=Bacillus sp. FJAT-22090 TaxID=1581038 RepID=UPI0006AE96B4|nr:hypothetical protein [Bacillus sp. FJAT-22090]ALC85575.1 hypothetical protein AM499_06880 [Bacillus sp. FJAT-22090]
MKYIIERYSTTGGDEPFKLVDKKATDINDYVNYHQEEEGYKLNSIIPFPDSGEHNDFLVILEEDKDYYDFGTMRFYDNASNEMFYEYERKNHVDLLQLLKTTDSLSLEIKDEIYECIYVSSKASIVDDGEFIGENLDIYFNVRKLSKTID